jgi:hypothetical protein
VQARGVSTTNLEILCVQKVKFKLKSPSASMKFVQSFVACPLEICSADILDLDFLQRVGDKISLTGNSLTLRNRPFPLSSALLPGRISSDPEVLQESARGLITHEPEEALDLRDDSEENESCIGTAELAESVSVPPLSGRIARSRVVRRGDSTEFKAPRNQVVTVDPEIRLPGIYIAQVVATLSNDVSNEISSGAHGSPRWSEVPLGSKDAEQLNSPCGKFDDLITSQEKAGSGERQPESPLNRLQAVAVNSLQMVAIALQEEESYRPFGNRFGNHTDTDIQNARRKGTKIKRTLGKQKQTDCGSKIIGYVPIQVMNLSLEEVKPLERMCVGLASPTETCVGNELARVQGVLELRETEKGDKGRSEITFELYLNEKLGHLTEQDRSKLELILRKYCHIFYQEDSSAIRCTSTVKHKIDTGDAQPIKKTPYRTPHALKPVVEEHIKDMLHKVIIEPSISPWSSSIVLV